MRPTLLAFSLCLWLVGQATAQSDSPKRLPPPAVAAAPPSAEDQQGIPAASWTGWNSQKPITAFFLAQEKEKKENGEEKKDKEGPKHTRDNGFLVEEASNQEPGVVQHIFNWVTLFDKTSQARTRDFSAVYVMELPLGSQKHQFSFVVQYQTAFEKPIDGPARQQGDVGDSLLNYRYQLLADDDFLWCAPRFSLILPTGDKRFGSGNGELGYQFNLPVSRYGESFDFHFNAGATLIPHVSLPLETGANSAAQDLRAYNLGASVFWKPKTNLHFFVETLGLRTDEIDDLGSRRGINQAFVNPGFRWAVCQLEDVEWVLGVSAPIGLTRATPDIGVFVYMSVEHTFRKINGNGDKK